MTLRAHDEDIDSKADRLVLSNTFMSSSFTSLDELHWLRFSELSKPRAKKRPSRSLSRRRQRKLSTRATNQLILTQTGSASEKRQDLFTRICTSSRNFLEFLDSGCNSTIASIKASATARGKTQDTVMECEPSSNSPPSLSETVDLDYVSLQLEKFIFRILQWEARLRSNKWPSDITEGGGDLLGIRTTMFSSLICLMENEIKLFEHISPYVTQLDSKSGEITKELKKLTNDAKELNRNGPMPESEASAKLGDGIIVNACQGNSCLHYLDATKKCIERLEESLRAIEAARASKRQQRKRRNVQHLSPTTSDHKFLSACTPSSAPIISTPQFSTSLPALFSRDRKHPLGPELHLKSINNGSTLPERESQGRKHVRFEQDEDQQAKKTCLGSINEEFLVRQLQKLIGLHDIWEVIKPNMHIDSLTTDVPQFAVVFITTDPAGPNLSSLPEPDLEEDDSEPGYSLPSNITKALINRISNEYRSATQAPDPLPSFMDAYIAMECSLALLESLPEWVLYAQSQYLDHVRTLLPVIQCCLLDSVLETSSNLATQLIISYTPNTLDDPQVLYTVKILHRLFSRLASVDIGRRLETEWKRLQQPNGDQSNDTAQHDEFTNTVDFFSVDDNHELQSEKGGPPSIPDKITLLELFVLFHFTDNAEDSIKSLADKTLQQSFVKERVEKVHVQ